MDRIFMHLRCVRCSKCSRIFCCVKHRVEHERRVHVMTAINSVAMVQTTGPVIKRRFRPTLPVNPVVNSRKRLHHQAIVTHPISGGLRMLAQQHQQQLLSQQSLHPVTTPMRNVLKATRRRSGLSIEHVRPVAESSPAIPLAALPSTPCTPYVSATAATSTMTTTGPPHEIGTPLPDDELGTPSFYQTPMQTMLLPDCAAKTSRGSFALPQAVSVASPLAVSVASPQAVSVASPLAVSVDLPQAVSVAPPQAVSVTPPQAVSVASPQAVSVASPQAVLVTPPQAVLVTPPQAAKLDIPGDENTCDGDRNASAKRVSLGQNTTPKGFFWSNVARRFRLALRPARPKVYQEKSPVTPLAPVTPLTPAVNIDVAKYYSNIHPRRPINNDMSTPVNSRPSLDDIRRAQDEANKAVNMMTEYGL